MAKPIQKDLSDQLNQTENYEAWANREQIIGEHIRNLENTRNALSKVISCQMGKKDGKKPTTLNAEGLLYEELYTRFYVLLTQVDIKIDKLTDGKIPENFKKDGKTLFQSILTRLVVPSSDSKKDITLLELHNALTMSAQTYDYLGYTAAERKIVRSRQMSDVAQSLQHEWEGEEIDV